MKKNRIKISITSLLFVLTFSFKPALAVDLGYNTELQDDILKNTKTEQKPNLKPRANYFDLANVVDSFFSSNDINNEEIPTDKKAKIRKEFIDITLKFNQGNASVAYDEYSEFLNKIDNDNALLILAEVFYKIGFYSLAENAIDKIINRNQFFDNIADLKKSYKPKTDLSKEDEIYFAKLYSDIYFNNSASEVISELTKQKRAVYRVNDCVDFTLARAYFENKKYDNALNYINKAISINPNNTNYQVFKLEILKNDKKYKEMNKLALKLKKSGLPVNFVNDVEIKYLDSLVFNTKNEKDKKYFAAKKSYLEGNFEKTKKECKSILNFDKDNDKIITLYAKSELALGKIENANSYFVSSYKLNKNNPETLIGLGDINYIHADYKSAIKAYKKAYKQDNSNWETIIKLTNAYREYAKKPKDLNKFETLLDNLPKSAYSAYFETAISLAQKNDVLKEEYLKRAMNINPLDDKIVGELVCVYLKNKSYELAKNLIYNAAFTLEKNYYYYYLCGLYNQAVNKNNDAIQFYKASLNLNPNFEIANTKLLDLIPNKNNEEI